MWVDGGQRCAAGDCIVSSAGCRVNPAHSMVEDTGAFVTAGQAGEEKSPEYLIRDTFPMDCLMTYLGQHLRFAKG